MVLNLYDLSPVNDCLYPIGIGLHHSGVEILGSEYAYGSGGGIFDATPKEVESGAVFRESISLGTFEGGSSQLRGVIDGQCLRFRDFDRIVSFYCCGGVVFVSVPTRHAHQCIGDPSHPTTNQPSNQLTHQTNNVSNNRF